MLEGKWGGRIYIGVSLVFLIMAVVHLYWTYRIFDMLERLAVTGGL